MLIKEGIYLGTRLSPAFRLFLAPSLPGWGWHTGKGTEARQDGSSPAPRRSQPHVPANTEPLGKETSAQTGCKGRERFGGFFSPERQENGFQGSIGASLLSPCPRSIQPVQPPTPPSPGAENGPFWNHTAKKKHSCAQGRGSSLILRDPSLCSGSGLAAMPLVPIPSFYAILPLSTAGACPWHVAESPVHMGHQQVF